MAQNTDISLRNQVIYSIYVRNHTMEGTFRSIIADLDRIKALGADIIWFLPFILLARRERRERWVAPMPTGITERSILPMAPWMIFRLWSMPSMREE